MEKRKLITVIAVVAALVILIAAVVTAYVIKSGNESFDTEEVSQTEIGESTDEKSDALPELKVIAVTERERDVLVETTYGDFTYPFAFSDVVSIKAESLEDCAQLQVYAVLAEKETLAYTIHYNKAQGDIFGTLKIDGLAEPVSLYVEFAEEPEGLADNWLATFDAVAETFNDVRVSMAEDEAFASAK